MTKAEERRLKERIRRLVTKYRRLFGLEDWLVHVTYDRDPELGRTGLAGADADPVYRTLILSFDLERMADPIEQRQLEYTIVHELQHCRTAPNRWLSEKVWALLLEFVDEHATTNLERMPIITDRIEFQRAVKKRKR